MSDTAKYKVAAGAILQSLYTKLFHVTCVAHLLDNYAMKVKSHFEKVDQEIAQVKSPIAINKTRQPKFASIGCLPQPVVTRPGSEIYAALYYANNLPEVKAIVESLKVSGILVTEAKVSLQATDMATQLFKVKDQYECVINLVETMESANKEAVPQSKNLTSEKTPAAQTVTFKKECKTITFL